MYIWNITTILEETFRKFWDSSFSVCVCVSSNISSWTAPYIYFGNPHLECFYTDPNTCTYIYIYKCDNVYMLPMSVWDVS